MPRWGVLGRLAVLQDTELAPILARLLPRLISSEHMGSPRRVSPCRLRTNRGVPRGGFIPAETLVQNGTAGDNGITGGTLAQSVLGFLIG